MIGSSVSKNLGLLTIPFFEKKFNRAVAPIQRLCAWRYQAPWNRTDSLSVSGCRKCLCGGGGRVLTEVRDLSNCPFEQ